MSTGWSGPLKEDASWHWDNDGTLTISGTGSAWFESDYPLWEALGLPVKRAVVESGITMIGWRFFAGSELESIILPDTLKTISEEVFAGCKNLTHITIPNSVAKIGAEAFYGCSQLKTIVFEGDSPEVLDSSGFDSLKLFTGVKATAIYPANNSTWTARVMKSYGGSITWSENISLAITAQPQTTYTKLGETAKVTVEAKGAGLAYQWYYRDAGAAKYSKSSNQKNTYQPVMNEASRDRSVYCVITDAFGESVRTETVYLRLAATITEQPVSVKVAKGEKAAVKVSAMGDDLTYSWYHANPGSSKFSKTGTFTGSTYSVEMSGTRNGRRVYCVVEDKYGNSHQSDVVTLSMIEPPVIITQPKTTYTKQGDTARVTVKAEGEGLSYQWYIKNVGDTKYSKSSNRKDTYQPVMSDASKDRLIYCVITNQYGASVKSDTVRLRMAATITAQPVNTSAPEGETVKVTVKAKGDGLTYKWYYKDAGSSSFKLTKTFTGNTYQAGMNEARDGRQLYCVVKDKYGKTAKSDVVTIGLPLEITRQPAAGYAANGKTVRVSVTAEGKGLSYQWYIKNTGESKYSKSSVTKSAYSATMSSKSRNRIVYCVVTDLFGNTVKTKSVPLRMTATIANQPEDMIVANGKKAVTKVIAMGDGLSYQWYIQNTGASKFSKSSVTSATYSCTMSAKADGRRAYCVVTDKYGYSVKSDPVTLTME